MKPEDLIKSRHSQHDRQLRCPVCHRAVQVFMDGLSKRSRFFPFCSERCKLIDLGAWLDADYRIPSRPDEEPDGLPTDAPPASGRP